MFRVHKRNYVQRRKLTLVECAAINVALMALLTDVQLVKCTLIMLYVKWFDDSHLLLNITKTKEMCLDGNENDQSILSI